MAENKRDQMDHLIQLTKRLTFGLGQPLIEIYYGIRKDTIPYWPLIGWGLLFDGMTMSGLDKKIFKVLKISWFYPAHPISYSIYSVCGVLLGFWFWGAIQARKRVSMIQRLSEVFQESGLKSPMGKLPNYIFDKPVDELVRRLRLTNAFLPKAKFVEAQDRLESALQVFIDDIEESKAAGTVDILYSHYEMTKMVPLTNISSIGKHRFFIGQTRAKPIYGSLIETPHLLIGGQTGGGKSTFLRQFILSLYANNQDYTFSLIDMKGGLEFQTFEGYERIRVYSTAEDAKGLFDILDTMLTERMLILKENGCKDIDELQSKPEKSIKQPSSVSQENMKIKRHIVIVDEAAELFLRSPKLASNDVQDLTRKAIRLAAQGRAVGAHLIIATQKPDAKAINTQIKANLTGIVSFPMATLGASFSILGNGRAKELPSIPGRAIWRAGLDQFEVQTPFISTDDAVMILDRAKSKKDKIDEVEIL